jgi:hypothetical protein
MHAGNAHFSKKLERKRPLSRPKCRWGGSRDSTVGIVTGYGLDNPGVGVRVYCIPFAFLLYYSTK